MFVDSCVVSVPLRVCGNLFSLCFAVQKVSWPISQRLHCNVIIHNNGNESQRDLRFICMTKQCTHNLTCCRSSCSVALGYYKTISRKEDPFQISNDGCRCTPLKQPKEGPRFHLCFSQQVFQPQPCYPPKHSDVVRCRDVLLWLLFSPPETS